MKLLRFVFMVVFAMAMVLPSVAQPIPAADPGGPPNVFYGGIAPNSNSGPVLVFVHGLGANAQWFWTGGNTMYAEAYNAGFRTAYISMNADSSQNTETVDRNAAVLTKLLPVITQRFGVEKVWLVCHSKGGLDAQKALLNTSVQSLVKGIFMLAAPNQGSMFATWIYTPEGQQWIQDNNLQSLLSVGMESIQTAKIQTLRSQVDPFFKRTGLPVMTMTGLVHNVPLDPVLVISGNKLQELTGLANDGLVTVPESHLPDDFAVNVAEVNKDHFQIAKESSFELIKGRIDGFEAMFSGFSRIATGGFGDRNNAWNWSMKWWKGKLYVGTGRLVGCVTFAASDAQNGTHIYPPKDSPSCTPDVKDLPLRAEIWRFTPETKRWDRVYQSPLTIPIGDNSSGQTRVTAREIGFRTLFTFTEPDGTDVMYAGGVSANCLYGRNPEFPNNSFPAPRILRSTDGVNWTPLPADPGTFMGDLIKNNTDINVVSFRSMEMYKGELFVTVTNLRGEGFIIASADPKSGNNAYRRVSPDINLLHVWALKLFNNRLYVAGGDREGNTGYTIDWTDASSVTPGTTYYNFNRIIDQGGWQANDQVRSPVALTVEVSNNMLYVGTNRKTEMIRIRPDDSWDVVVGYPRTTPTGEYKQPVSGIFNYFNNVFNAHFWQMRDTSNGLYMGTYDESLSLQQAQSINPFFNAIMGFDLMQSKDGVFWNQVSYSGMGDTGNFGGRSMETSPLGFFLGTARSEGGAQVWYNNGVLDYNKDSIIDQKDVNLLMAAVNPNVKVAQGDPRDLDEDRRITVNDARKLMLQCTFAGCTGVPSSVTASLKAKVAAPTQLIAGPESQVGRTAMLTWNPVPGAVRYHVYRMTHKTLGDIIPGPPPGGTGSTTQLTFEVPGLGTVTLPQDLPKLAVACEKLDVSVCNLLPILQNPPVTGTLVGFPSAPLRIAVTTTNAYTEPAPTALQSMYWIRAEDAAGNLSEPSNVAGAPALAAVAPSSLR